MNVELIPFDLDSEEHIEWVAALWNSAVPEGYREEMPISPALVRFNVQLDPAMRRLGRIALDLDGRPLAFVLASLLEEQAEHHPAGLAWIDALAVALPFQEQGIGRDLLRWAEDRIRRHGGQQIRLGGGMYPLFPGVPESLSCLAFFEKHGFSPVSTHGEHPGETWELARNLNDYRPPTGLDALPCAVYPARPGQEDELLSFLSREFPGRAYIECQRFLADGGRTSDYMLLWTDDGLNGACRVSFEDSTWPIERHYPYRLPRRWGHLRPIGTSATMLDHRFELALVDKGLQRLHNNGVNGCVLGETTRIQFFTELGFQPLRRYFLLDKSADPN